MNKVKVMVLTGEGINCEHETSEAFKREGASVDKIHLSEWFEAPEKLLSYQILAIPGGFSYGDELHSGQILALKMKYSLGHVLQDFIQKKGLIIGICNGFQVLMKLGAFENFTPHRTMTLFHNKSNKFQNRWVKCEVPHSNCIWTRGLTHLSLPVRHGEGRIIVSHDELPKGSEIALVYKEDINGSFQRIAGLSDSTGQIFGLMPHPEAALEISLYPEGFEQEVTLPLSIFTNAIQYAQELSC